MLIVTAPTALDNVPIGGRRLFLAGGITNCPDWQAEMCELLEDTALVLLNPRRPEFPPLDAPDDIVEEQIRWEYMHLRLSDAILFWFPSGESPCPIAMYELGSWSRTPVPLFVGTGPAYPRRRDVLIQLGLVRPDLVVVDDLSALAEQVKSWEMEP